MGRLWNIVRAALTPRKGAGCDGKAGDRGKPADGAGRAPTFRERTAPLARNKMVLLLIVMVGGALGTGARYLIANWFNSWATAFPLGTLVINVSGAFVLAVAYALLQERLPPDYRPWLLFIGTGFCGGYTTFSTFELETYLVARDRSWLLAFANVGGSVVAGFAGVLLGFGLVAVLFGRR